MYRAEFATHTKNKTVTSVSLQKHLLCNHASWLRDSFSCMAASSVQHFVLHSVLTVHLAKAAFSRQVSSLEDLNNWYPSLEWSKMEEDDEKWTLAVVQESNWVEESCSHLHLLATCLSVWLADLRMQLNSDYTYRYIQMYSHRHLQHLTALSHGVHRIEP